MLLAETEHRERLAGSRGRQCPPGLRERKKEGGNGRSKIYNAHLGKFQFTVNQDKHTADEILIDEKPNNSTHLLNYCMPF